MEQQKPEITMTISSAGQPILHRNFCVETPALKIFEDGLVVKAYKTDVNNSLFSWRKDVLEPDQHEQLYKEIEALGFWEWDVEQINAEIDAIPQHFDVPMYTLDVKLNDRQKKFYARGIEIYYEDWKINSLENPCKVFDTLRAMETTDEVFVPSKIELLVLTGDYEDYEYLDDDPNLLTVPWPYEDFPLDGLEHDWRNGARISDVEGDAIASMVELIDANMYFTYKERNYLVRYRPIL